jgi:hypothetical protein
MSCSLWDDGHHPRLERETLWPVRGHDVQRRGAIDDLQISRIIGLSHQAFKWAGRAQGRDMLIQMPNFAESLKYLAKADIRGELRTTKNRHSSVRRQPMYESRRPHQVQDEDQQYSRCRELSQITRSVGRTQPPLPLRPRNCNVT